VCTTDQKKMACVTDTAITALEGASGLSAWGGKKLCVKRNGDAAVSANGKVIRPEPASGTCPTGYKKCGTGDYNTAKSTCTATANDCPLTSLTLNSDGTVNSTSQTANSLPITDAIYALGTTTQKPCLVGSGTSNTYAAGTHGGTTSAPTWAQAYAGTCSAYDTRFTSFGAVKTSTVFLTENVGAGSPYCTGGGQAIPGQAGSSTTKVLSFANNDVAVATNGNLRLYGVTTLNANEATTYCTGSDTLCNTLVGRTPCAKISQYATSSVNTGKSLEPVYMPEVFYKIAATCATKSELIDAQPQVDDVKSAIGTQLGIQWAAYVLGICAALCAIFRDYQGMYVEVCACVDNRLSLFLFSSACFFCCFSFVFGKRALTVLCCSSLSDRGR